MSVLSMCIYVYECMCTTCIPEALRSQRRTLDPLELELWMGAGN